MPCPVYRRQRPPLNFVQNSVQNGILTPETLEAGCLFSSYLFFVFGAGSSSYVAVSSCIRESLLSALSANSISFAPSYSVLTPSYRVSGSRLVRFFSPLGLVSATQIRRRPFPVGPKSAPVHYSCSIPSCCLSFSSPPALWASFLFLRGLYCPFTCIYAARGHSDSRLQCRFRGLAEERQAPDHLRRR